MCHRLNRPRQLLMVAVAVAVHVEQASLVVVRRVDVYQRALRRVVRQIVLQEVDAVRAFGPDVVGLGADERQSPGQVGPVETGVELVRPVLVFSADDPAVEYPGAVGPVEIECGEATFYRAAVLALEDAVLPFPFADGQFGGPDHLDQFVGVFGGRLPEGIDVLIGVVYDDVLYLTVDQ